MQKIETSWEDEENNRQVALAVEYTRKNDAIEIAKLTPKQVTFLCPRSKSPLRSVGVWTDKGRDLLVNQLRESGKLAAIEQEIDGSLAV
ncbi:MAG: hypothetical protein MI725_06145 [Pirellulales bacterium]|nr:hypothetical protein [Pirellulales bacterium]